MWQRPLQTLLSRCKKNLIARVSTYLFLRRCALFTAFAPAIFNIIQFFFLENLVLSSLFVLPNLWINLVDCVYFWLTYKLLINKSGWNTFPNMVTNNFLASTIFLSRKASIHGNTVYILRNIAEISNQLRTSKKRAVVLHWQAFKQTWVSVNLAVKLLFTILCIFNITHPYLSEIL